MTEMMTSSPVSFTPSAIEEIKKLLASETAKRYLRVGAKGGGCSGLSYVLEMDAMQENDELFETDGIFYIMDKNHGLYLYGMQINWDNGLNNRGFTFTNPNASKTCGCGSSFAV
ncbi:MAG: iron-sulfur cluster assembly accessory protein [Chitinophagaceae bacterium]|nr:iron-sulfur cluster assembly accessory protein [Chitinophagaceae bacterium]